VRKTISIIHVLICHCVHTMGTCVSQWLSHWTPDWVVWVQALAGSLCRVLDKTLTVTLTVLLSTQEYKWVLANCQGNMMKCWGITCNGLASHPGGVAIFLVASCYWNQNKLWHLWATRLVRLNLFPVGTWNGKGRGDSLRGTHSSTGVWNLITRAQLFEGWLALTWG